MSAVRWSEPAMVCGRPGCPNPVQQTGRGRERRYCSDTCRAAVGRLRRQERDAIELAELLVAAPERRRISALLALSDAERQSLRAAL